MTTLNHACVQKGVLGICFLASLKDSSTYDSSGHLRITILLRRDSGPTPAERKPTGAHGTAATAHHLEPAGR
mgnify:CR=1 FL=1